MIALISVIHGGGQLAVMFFDPILSTFLAATAAMVALVPLARWKRYSEPAEDVELQVVLDQRPKDEDAAQPVMGLAMALVPLRAISSVARSAARSQVGRMKRLDAHGSRLRRELKTLRRSVSQAPRPVIRVARVTVPRAQTS